MPCFFGLYITVINKTYKSCKNTRYCENKFVVAFGLYCRFVRQNRLHNDVSLCLCGSITLLLCDYLRNMFADIKNVLTFAHQNLKCAK